jgi:cytochrome P450
VTTIPGERGHWLWGSAHALARAPHIFPAELGWRFGGLASFRVLHRRVIAVTDADLARQILVTRQERYRRSFHARNARAIVGSGLLSTDGATWLSHRRQMLPAFHRERLMRLGPIVREATLHLLESWEAQRRQAGTVALAASMQELAIAVMGQALLSTGLDSGAAARFGAAVRDSLAVLRARNNARLRLPLWVPTRANRNLVRTRGVLDRFVRGHIDTRATADRPGASDMLDALLTSRDPETGAPFDGSALRDETKTLFVAGFETTATALTWVLYLLARHHDAAARWHEELDRVLAGRPPDWPDFERLPVTRAILDEALRLYPPVYSLPRECAAEDELGGHRIRPGTIMLVSIFGIHRSPSLWPEPDQFRPDRFAPGARWPAHALLPFGVGKHACIGADFASAEMMMALALIGQRYRLALADPAPVEMAARITLAPAREIPLRLLPRAPA